MSEPHLPDACRRALAALEADPLAPGPEAERHLRVCLPCAEARVHWLALQDTTAEAACAQAPIGYFDRLPGRLVRKLPAPRRNPRPLLWAAAALLLAGAGTGGFFLGRLHRPPVVEAAAPERLEGLPEAPFQTDEDPLQQLQTLSPEEARRVLDGLRAPSRRTGAP